MTPVALREPSLVNRLQEIATWRQTTPENLLRVAVSQWLTQITREKIRAEQEAFQRMHAELVEQYPGEYVAVHQGQVVDHDPDLRTLHLRVYARYGKTPVLLKRVTEEPERDLVIRSPRIERESIPDETPV